MMVLVQQKAVLFGTWWYWVRRRQYWLIHDGTGSVCGSTCWYLVALDQYKAVMVDPSWYLVSIGRYWTTCWYLVVLDQHRVVMVDT